MFVNLDFCDMCRLIEMFVRDPAYGAEDKV